MTKTIPDTPAVLIEHGLRPEHVDLAAEGYWQAFSRKLRWPLGPKEKAISFIADSLNSSHAISAVSETGHFLGVAGFKTPSGAFVGGDFKSLAKTYGALGALGRGFLIAFLERDCEPDTLLMDGIFVQTAARGHGVGAQLLAAVQAHAVSMGLHQVRLDVIDTNPRARALYEREGFVPTSRMSLGPLKHVFGFASAVTMVKLIA